MKKIRVNIFKIKNYYYAKIPNIVAEKLDIKNGEDIDISIFNKNQKDEQMEIWDIHPEDVDEITFPISRDVHTMNMYNRIYVPQEYRFFFPKMSKDFILSTNVGNISTHITSNGYFTKGLRQWFAVNGPIMPKDILKIKLLKEESNLYELNYIKEDL
tara:strand:- start:1706 stop:2176 length:471 start_codon:yes stop_codon:yes gene_type:complete